MKIVGKPLSQRGIAQGIIVADHAGRRRHYPQRRPGHQPGTVCVFCLSEELKKLDSFVSGQKGDFAVNYSIITKIPCKTLHLESALLFLPFLIAS
jgi:hypothetical protein